ncbi:MAG: AAA family ATPase [Candidatus Heimdallarchaeota archaeon]|nr:AAA family ATPase [Candidatus Heimdallarchaeota archaeon]
MTNERERIIQGIVSCIGRNGTSATLIIKTQESSHSIKLPEDMLKELNLGDKVSVITTIQGNRICVKQIQVIHGEVELKFADLTGPLDLEKLSSNLETTVNRINNSFFPTCGFTVLINEDLSDKIKHFNKPDKKRMHKVIRDLQWGYWKEGVRVKKLKGVKSPVFEARLDKARRLLFSIKSIPKQDEKKTAPTLILEDIVKHKYINQGANLIHEVERLNIQNYNMALMHEAEIEDEITDIDELRNLEIYENLKGIFKEKIIEEVDDNKNVTGLPNGVKYYRFDDDIRELWVDDDKGTIKQILALSPYQQQIIYEHGPVLINGGAGTGKTTVLAHIYSHYMNLENQKFIYLTLTSYLQTFIHEIIKQMNFKGDLLVHNIRTLDDVALDIIGSDKERFPDRFRVNVFDFLDWIKNFPEFAEYDSLLLWQEYYGIIKGFCEDTRLGILTLKEYLSVSDQISLVSKEERDRIYWKLREYHMMRRDLGMWDSIDLAQFTLCKIKKLPEKTQTTNVTGIICDEVQDFVKVQYLLFNKLINNKHKMNLYFGGDNHQTINSSNFRWEDMKEQLYHNLNLGNDRVSMRDVIHMTRNFRSTTRLIEVANAFLKLKEELGIDEKLDQLQKGIEEEDTKHYPGLLIDKGIPLDELKYQLENNNSAIIIVYSEKSKQEVEKRLDMKLLQSIAEVKGLEFPNSFLLNLATDSGITWRKVFDFNISREYISQNSLLLKYVFNRIYVGITRARRQLIIYEESEDAHLLWENLTTSSLKTGDSSMLQTYWKIPTSKEEFFKEAEYLYKNERYSIAAEYYKSAGDMSNYKLSMAHYFMSRRDFEPASRFFREINELELAANALEEFDIIAAKELYRQLNDKNGVLRCDAKSYYLNGEKLKAARKLEEIGEHFQAAKIYSELGKSDLNHHALALNHEKYQEWDKAIEQWKLAKNKNREIKARMCLAESQEAYPIAAKYAEQLQLWTEAHEFWNHTKNTTKIKFTEAKMLESRGKYEMADKRFKAIDEWEHRLKMWKEQDNHRQVAIVYAERAEVENKPQYFSRAAQILLHLKDYNGALEYYQKARDNKMISELFEQMEEFEKAAEYAEIDNQWKRAGLLWMRVNELQKAEKALDRAGPSKELAELKELLKKTEEAIEIYEQILDYEKAAELAEKTGDWHLAARNYANFKRWEKAAKLYEMAGNHEMAAECLINTNNRKHNNKIGELLTESLHYKKANGYFEKCNNYAALAKNYQTMKNYLRAAQYSEEAAKNEKKKSPKPYWRNAAKFWLKVDGVKQAIYCYEMADDKKKALKLAETYEHWEKAADLQLGFDNFEIAAEYYIKAEIPAKAANCYFELKQYEKALPLFEVEKDIAKIAECQRELGNLEEAADAYKEINHYREAGQIYEELEDFENAIECYSKGTNQRALARIHRKMQNNLEAANILKNLGEHQEAAELYESEGELLNAANQYQAAENYEDAKRLFKIEEKWAQLGYCEKQLGRKEAAIEAYEKAGMYDEIGLIFKQDLQFDSAIIYFSKSDNKKELAECNEQIGSDREAYKFYKILKEYRKIRKYSKMFKDWEMLLESAEALEYYDDIFLALENLKRWDECVNLILKYRRQKNRMLKSIPDLQKILPDSQMMKLSEELEKLNKNKPRNIDPYNDKKVKSHKNINQNKRKKRR